MKQQASYFHLFITSSGINWFLRQEAQLLLG